MHAGNGPAEIGLAAGAFVQPVQDQVGISVDFPVVDGGRGVDHLTDCLQPVDLVGEILGRLVGLDLDEVRLAIRFDPVRLVDVPTTDGLIAGQLLEGQLLEPLMI